MPKSLIRHNQPVLTRINPHQGNRRFIKCGGGGEPPPDPPVFSGSISNITGTEGEAITPVDVSGNFSTGGAVTGYSLNGAPAWMNINASGVISGTPPDDTDTVGITVTGTNADGSDTSNAFNSTIAPAFTGTHTLTVGTTGGKYGYEFGVFGAISPEFVGGEGISQCNVEATNDQASLDLSASVGSSVTWEIAGQSPISLPDTGGGFYQLEPAPAAFIQAIEGANGTTIPIKLTAVP